MTDPTTWPISGLKYGPVHVSGASTTPSTDIISPATIFRITSPPRTRGGQPIRPLLPVLRTGCSGMDTRRADSAAGFARHGRSPVSARDTDLRGTADPSRVRVAVGGALQQDGAFGDVLGERGRAAELGGGLVVAAEPGQQVTADAGQVVVAGQRGFGGQAVDDRQATLGAVG